MTAEELFKLIGALGLGSIFGGIATAWIKELFDRKKRADAIVLKLLDAKLKAYEVIQPALIAARTAVALEIATRGWNENSKQRRDADQAFEALWHLERQHGHVISSDAIAAIGEFQRCRLLAAPDGDADITSRLAGLYAAITKVDEAIRSDCQTDALDEHAKAILASVDRKLPGRKPEGLPP